MGAEGSDREGRQRLNYERVVRVAGRIAPWKISAILALNASVDDLDQAVAWASAESGSDGPRRTGGDGMAGSIHEILVSDQPDSDE